MQYAINQEKRFIFWSDKLYQKIRIFDELAKTKSSIMYTPKKEIKGVLDVIRQKYCAVNDLFFGAVPTIRQLVESYFNRHIQNKNIRRTSRILYTNGFNEYVFG